MSHKRLPPSENTETKPPINQEGRILIILGAVPAFFGIAALLSSAADNGRNIDTPFSAFAQDSGGWSHSNAMYAGYVVGGILLGLGCLCILIGSSMREIKKH